MISTRDSRKERGATLLSVLVIVLVMSAAAITATDALSRSVSIAKASAAQTDTYWTALAAADAGEAVLGELVSKSGTALSAGAPLFADPVVLPAGHSIVSLQAREGSNCFNLNQVTGEPDDDNLVTYRDLLIASGFTDGDAETLVQTLADWIDSDNSSRSLGAEDSDYRSLNVPHRAPGTLMNGIEELRSVSQYTPDVIARLGRLVCVRPSRLQTALNLNTLTAEDAPLLVALYAGEFSVDDAEALILSRPPGGWADMDEFQSEPPVQRIAENVRDAQAVALVSTYFDVAISIQSAVSLTQYDALYGPGTEKPVDLLSLRKKDET